MCPKGMNLAPELTRSMPKSVPSGQEMGLCALAGGESTLGLYNPHRILVPSWDGLCHLQEQLVIQAQPLARPSRAGVATVPGMATNARDTLPTAGLATRSPKPSCSPRLALPLPRSAPIPLPARPSRSPGLAPRTDPPVNAQNRRHLTNNQLRSAATGTSPARAAEVVFTADSHQRNFQK